MRSSHTQPGQPARLCKLFTFHSLAITLALSLSTSSSIQPVCISYQIHRNWVNIRISVLARVQQHTPRHSLFPTIGHCWKNRIGLPLFRLVRFSYTFKHQKTRSLKVDGSSLSQVPVSSRIGRFVDQSVLRSVIESYRLLSLCGDPVQSESRLFQARHRDLYDSCHPHNHLGGPRSQGSEKGIERGYHDTFQLLQGLT